MNINELNSLKLSDYTKFHDVLNPKLWTKNHELQPDVKTALLAIAEDFKTFLGVSDFNLKDITMSGSNAGYNYNPTSDIDLHLVVDLPEVDISEVYRELFDAKKYQYNDVHDIKIHGADVELYVQNANQPHHSQGIYSLLNDKWIIFPKKIKTEIDDVSVVSKYLDLKARIESALDSDDITVSENLLKKIKNMRVDGLAQHGEFGVENLTFKLLRSEGLIGQLRDHRTKLHDQELSLLERGRKKNKKRRRYAYGGFWYPGYSFSSSEGSAGGESGESIFEGQDKKNSLAEFAVEIIRELGITNIPKVLLHKDKSWTEKTGSFGRFDPEANVLHLATADRHILDILRTMAHELVHCAQRHRGKLPPDAGETGSAYEDEANALAGRIMRGFAERRPELFRGIQLESSGYIPTEAEKNDPRFSTALTVDVQPGETGRQANKLGLQTDSQGHPALLRPGKKTQLAESRPKVKAEEDWHPNDRPPGPEIKPTMPRGTVRVDVSDIYDWYKLGKQISNLDQADPTQFGKGPPSTIVSFGDEDTEHKYLQGLNKLGLTTTDLDPVDPNQPAGMRRQKTDPTYNVNEVSNPRYKFLRPGELTGSYTDQQLRDLGFKKSQNGTWFIAWDRWNRLTDPKNPKIKEDLDQPSDLPSINLAKQNLNKILAAAQRIYDNWNESEVDTYAGGGICHLIADAICDVMWDMNIECTTVSCSYEQHVYVAVKVEEGVYTIDIPYGIYEEGGGFSWKKIPDIKFESKNVVFYKVSGDPKEFDNYTALEENKIVKKKIISGNKSQSNILTIQGVDDNLLSEKVQELIDQGKSSDKAIKQIAYEFELPEQKISKAFYKQSLAEGKMAELDMDLEDPEITDRQFEKIYGMTRKEAKELFSRTNMWDFPQVRDPDKPLHEQGATKDSVIFLNDNTVIVGQEHGKSLELSPETLKRVQAIAEKYGAWYEGNGMDREFTKGIIDDYQGSWDDDLLSPSIKGYPYPFLYVLFSNIKANDTVKGKIGSDPKVSIFDRILNTQPSTNYFPDRKFDAETLTKFLQSVSEGPYDFVKMSQAPATEKNVERFFQLGEKLMWPENWEEYPNKAGQLAKQVNDLRDKFLASRKSGVYVVGSGHLLAVRNLVGNQGVAEGSLSEMDKSAPQPGRDGKVSHSTYGSRDKKGSDYFKGTEAPGKAVTAKQAAKDALDILKKQGVAESLRIDVPNENWLQGKIDYAKKKGRDRFGAPYFNATTAYFTDDVRVPIQVLRKLPGMRGEQQNVRQNDLAAIKKILKDTGKLPLGRDGKEYVPFVMVAYNGEAWVNEGNHRIMAAAELFDEGDTRFASLPVELKYFDGGERIKDGPLYPSKIGFDNQGVAEGELVESLRREFELLENEFIGEIKMSPSNLRAEIAKIPGALAGMEFEMIVPRVSNPDNIESEPDYSDNPRPNSIEDIEEFFHDGDFNGRNTINRLVTELNESWTEWVDSNFESVWQNNEDAYLYNFVRNELDPEITAELLGFDSDNRPDRFTRNQLTQVADIIQDSGSELYNEAYQFALNAYINGGNQREWLTSLGIESMSDVPVEFSVVNWPYWTAITNEQKFSIEDIALNFMKSIGQNTVAMSESRHGEYSKWDGSDWQAVGRTKPQDCYTVEPDGSLRPPNDNYFGLEFVSPPMPVDDMVRDLNAVRKWAQSVGAKTGPNYRTGLHINVSVPELSDSDNLDFVKLALLVGDQYVLNQFGRSSNEYARSALGLVRDRVRDRPDVAKSLLDRMKGHLQKLASRALHSGEVSKYTSIHPKDGYIEFRSPGGDWLDEDFDKIEDTLMRFVVSTQAAVDPEAYKEEYLDRLYKLLTGQSYGRDPETGDLEWQVTSKKETPYQDTRTLKSGQTVSTTKHKPEFETTVTASSAKQAWNQVKSQLSPDAQASDYTVKRAMTDSGDKDLLKFFAQYSAGKLPETALRSFVKQAQLQREVERKQTTGQRYWWKVYRDREGEPNTAVIEVVAANKKQAIEKAAAEWGVFSREYISRITAEPVRLYVEPLPDPNAPVLNGRPSNPDGNFYIASSQDTNTPLYRFMATTDSDARFVLDQWQRLYGRDFVYRLDHLQRRGQPRTTQVPNTSTSVPSRQTDIENTLGLASQAADANWEIVDRSNYQPVFLFIANTPQDARRVYERWLTAWGYDQDTEDYGFRERARPGSTLDIQRQRAEQSARAAVQSTGNILWQIVDSADGQVAYEFYLSAENNQQDANEVGMRWVRNNGNPNTSYSVRAQTQQPGTAVPQDRQGNTQWRILVGGEEVHRFWNRPNQDEANTAAQSWILDQIRRGLLSPAEGAEVEVVPVMGNRT